MVYRRYAAGDLTLESTAFGEGRILAAETGTGYDYTPNYFITDHLGSTRAIVELTAGSTVNVNERSDFYPFGARHINPAAAITDNRYRFSGKEDQESIGLHFQDFGARMYDPKIGRWWSLDPLAEKYYPISPYAYVGNNPIRLIDPDGRKWVDSKGRLVWQNGGYTKYATADHQRIGDNLRGTVTGSEQFGKLVNHSKPIQTIINTTDAPTKRINGAEYRTNGIARKTVLINDKTTLISGVITLYEKNIETAAESRGIDIDEQLAATTGHEIEHFSEENMQLGENHPDKEIEPTKVADDIIREYRQKPVATSRALEINPPLP